MFGIYSRNSRSVVARSFVAWLSVFLICSLLDNPTAHKAQSTNTKACSLIKLEDVNLSPDDLSPTSGNKGLDSRVRTISTALRTTLHLNAAVRFFEEVGNPNAFAVSKFQGGSADGEVLVGKKLLSEIADDDSLNGDARLNTVLAHEMAHLFQFKRQNKLGVKESELQADFIAGWWLAKVLSGEPNRSKESDAAFFKVITDFFDRGDYDFNNPDHHGTRKERLQAINAGFQLGTFDPNVAYDRGSSFAVNLINPKLGAALDNLIARYGYYELEPWEETQGPASHKGAGSYISLSVSECVLSAELKADVAYSNSSGGDPGGYVTLVTRIPLANLDPKETEVRQNVLPVYGSLSSWVVWVSTPGKEITTEMSTFSRFFNNSVNNVFTEQNGFLLAGKERDAREVAGLINEVAGICKATPVGRTSLSSPQGLLRRFVVGQADNYQPRSGPPAASFKNGKQALEQSKFLEAENEFRKAVSDAPRDAEYRRYLAAALFLQDNWAEAEEHFVEAVRLNPNDPQLLREYAFCLFKVEKNARAIDILERAVQLAPDDAVIRANLGDMFIAFKRWREAEIQYRKAISLKNNAEYFYGLAQSLKGQGKIVGALDAAKKAVALEPANPKYAQFLRMVDPILPGVP